MPDGDGVYTPLSGKSTRIKMFSEFIGTFLFAVIYFLSIPFNAFLLLPLALVFGALKYAFYPFSGGYFNSGQVIFELIAGSSPHKLGYDATKRFWLVLGYMFTHAVGTILGFALGLLFSLGVVPTVSWTSTVALAFFGEMFAALAFYFIVAMVTDAAWARQESIVLRDGKLVPYLSMNPYYGLAAAFARAVLSLLFLDMSGGVLNPWFGFVINVFRAIATTSAGPLTSAVFYLTAHLLGAVIGGLVYYALRELGRERWRKSRRKSIL